MAKEEFQPAAGKHRLPYRFDYAVEVENFYLLHPTQKKNTFFIDTSVRAPVLRLVEGQDMAAVAGQIMSNASLIENIKDAYKTGTQSKKYAGNAYIMINIPMHRKNLNLLGPAATADMMDVFTFDHEIGHMLAADTKSTEIRNMDECLADAYAVIRHLQRFGTASRLAENVEKMRAIEMICAEDQGVHFTSPVVRQILSDSRNVDFSKLTPQQTVQTAAAYAKQFALTEQAAQKLSDTFSAFHGRYLIWGLAQGDFQPLRELGSLVLSSQDPLVSRWGATALRALLQEGIDYNGAHIRPSGKEWPDLLKALDNRTLASKPPKFNI